jgi:hypothetical protein
MDWPLLHSVQSVCLESTQPHIQWVEGERSSWVKWVVNEDKHSLSYGVWELVELLLRLRPSVFMACGYIKTHSVPASLQVTVQNSLHVLPKLSVVAEVRCFRPRENTARITYSKELSLSWATNKFSASQEISCILWNWKFHYHSHKYTPPVPILSQLDPVHAPHTTSWRSILILSSHLRLGFPSGLFPSGFPTKTLWTPLSSPIRATCPAHLILLDFITVKYE